MPTEVKKETTEKDQFLFYVFVTALEGGIGYWAESLNYHWQNKDGSDDLEGFSSEVIDAEEGDCEDSAFKKAVINKEIIRKGIANIRLNIDSY